MAEDEQHSSSEEAGYISRFCTFKRRWIVRAKSKQGLMLKASTLNSSVSKALLDEFMSRFRAVYVFRQVGAFFWYLSDMPLPSCDAPGVL